MIVKMSVQAVLVTQEPLRIRQIVELSKEIELIRSDCEALGGTAFEVEIDYFEQFEFYDSCGLRLSRELKLPDATVDNFVHTHSYATLVYRRADNAERDLRSEQHQLEPSGFTLEWLQQQAHSIAVEHGWGKEERNFGELMMLVVTEVAEAMEEWRNGRDPGEVYYKANSNKLEGVPSELADILIRVADLAEYYGINLTTVVREKMQYNNTRPYRHGGKRA